MIVIFIAIILLVTMFGFLFKSKPQETSLPGLSFKTSNFLKDAGDAFIDMCVNKNISLFEQFGTVKCLRRLSSKMDELNQLQFGLERYREISWKVIEKDPEAKTVKLQQKISQKNVKIGKGYEIPLGDEILRVWTVNEEINKAEEVL